MTEAGTQRPLSDAQISVVGTQLGAVTHAAGDFVISGVPAGARSLRAAIEALLDSK